MESPSWSKLTQLVSHHVFCHIHGNELFSIVHTDGQSQEFGGDGAGAAPGFDDVLFTRCLGSVHFLLEFNVYEWWFF